MGGTLDAVDLNDEEAVYERGPRFSSFEKTLNGHKARMRADQAENRSKNALYTKDEIEAKFIESPLCSQVTYGTGTGALTFQNV